MHLYLLTQRVTKYKVMFGTPSQHSYSAVLQLLYHNLLFTLS